MSDEELFRRMSRSATLSLIAVCVALAVSLVNTYDRATANYELETGEYLHCTPQGGNHLACEVKHRSETPEVAQK